ncbi:MAG: exodeoxyribonuclease VII small subunit [Alphaproteobacteria bacterium]|nr:exodeoxyribonuclease VII small subunit [Alphaproteobacteria bacterium]
MNQPINDGNQDIAVMEFEQALTELQTIVKSLERGDVKLEEAIRLYERGVLLKKHCESKLRQAQLKIEQIMVDDQGQASQKQTVTVATPSGMVPGSTKGAMAKVVESERSPKNVGKTLKQSDDGDVPF